MENFILAFILSVIANIFLIKIADKYCFFMDPLANQKIQSFHKTLTPRAGGISIYLLSLTISYFISKNMFLLVLSFFPAFIYGVYEDIKGNTPQKIRLLVMAISALLASLSTGLTIKSVGFFAIPEFMQIPLTIFAVIGISSALNFIDGLNGLASGVAIITFGFIGLSALSIGHNELFMVMFYSAFIMMGFFVFNFPFGRIFLGDAGAYFLGYLLAVSSEALVFGNSQISPWFPAALLGYPIIETLFTIWRRYRRLKTRGIKFFKAEKVHMHSLLYLRVFKNNSLASFAILSFFTLSGSIAYLFRTSTIACFLLFLTEAAIYLFIYRNIVNFKLGKLVIAVTNMAKQPSPSYTEPPKLRFKDSKNISL